MIAQIQKGILILFAAWIATGCGMVRRTTYIPTNAGSPPPAIINSQQPEEPGEPSPKSDKDPPASLNDVKVSLMQAYREWEGTPYQFGGSSKDGVDCSQLVNIIFDEYLGISLPNTTRTQLNMGEGVRRSAIRTGDLVFFRTGRKTLHVGIALNHGEFLHASSSEGVTISKLGYSYWRERFLTARRVLD